MALSFINLFQRTYGASAPTTAAEHTDPNEVGYCYLHLIKPGDRARCSSALGPLARRSAVEDLLLDQPDVANDTDYFRVTIRRPQDLKSGNYWVHIETTNQHESAMRWREVLSVAPFGSVFGADSPDLAVRETISHIPNPHTRRFFFFAFTVGFATSQTHNFSDIAANSLVKAYTQIFPIVTAVRLTAHFHPTAKATNALTSLGLCWSESTKNNIAEAMTEPNFNLHSVGPAGAGGIVQPFSVVCPFDAIVSRQMKPDPRFGSFPGLYCNWTCTQLGSEALTLASSGPPAVSADVLFKVYIELVVDASPTQPIS